MKIFSQKNATRFWNNIKTWASGKFVAKVSGKGLSTNDYTNEDKEKLQGLSKITVDSSLSSSSTNPVQNKAVNAALGGKVDKTSIGSPGGVAELDSGGKVPASQLPSYVDDVVEGYYYNGQFYQDSGHGQQITPESSKIYIDLSTNKTYRWSGSTYVVISGADGLALGETAQTAYRGDRGKVAYDHSQEPHAPSDAEKNVQADWNESDSGSDAFIKNKPAALPANGGNASTVNGHTVKSDVPENAVFTDTKYQAFTGASSSAAGKAGLVPQPAAGDTEKLLCSDGTWAEEMSDEEIDAICV